MKGLADFFARRPQTESVIFAGKGGLGKTTCSAALAYHMATVEGRRTLCFSTDPQASLSDVFEQDIYGRGVVELFPNLHVVEIDADRRVAAYQQEVKEKIRTMYGLQEVPAEIEEYINATSAEPAMYESATYDAMAELVAAREFDLYIFDMPPFGHGVRMVAMADVLSRWVEKITEARGKVAEYEAVVATLKGERGGEDLMMQELLAIRQKIRTFTDLMTDRQRTAFFMVLVPEKMAIVDTQQALKMFKDLGIGLSGLIVNQVYPRALLDRPRLSDLLRHRIAMQQGHLQVIRQQFGEHLLAALPMYSREPKGLGMLAEIAKALMLPSPPL